MQTSPVYAYPVPSDVYDYGGDDPYDYNTYRDDIPETKPRRKRNGARKIRHHQKLGCVNWSMSESVLLRRKKKEKRQKLSGKKRRVSGIIGL